MKFEQDEIVFSSGRRCYVHAQVVGISPDLELSYGYDGGIPWPIKEWRVTDAETLTAADVRELADYMIAQWQKFRETLEL